MQRTTQGDIYEKAIYFTSLQNTEYTNQVNSLVNSHVLSTLVYLFILNILQAIYGTHSFDWY